MAKTAKAKTTKANPGKSLEGILFDCRNVLRGKVESSIINRDAVMGLVFLKFAGDKYAARRAELEKEYSDVPPAVWDKASFYLSENVFYLREHCRWAYLVENAASDDIANMIDKAMSDIEHDNEPLRGALPHGLYTNLRVETRTVKSLIDTINQISTEHFGSEDLIGRVYEYFMQSFAMDEVKDQGEFYTPRSIVELIAELIEPYEGRIYDPCCGSGGMFVQSVKFIEAHNGQRIKASVFGQESSPSTYRLAKMNLAIRGITCDLGKYNSSSFTDDQHKDLKADFIMANPPFNLKDWRGKNELTADGRWTGYGLPPTGNANYAWILHMLSKLDVSHGIAGFLLANGALSADDEELTIRRRLIENDKVEAIIVLPRNMFYTTDISVTLWIMNNGKSGGAKNGRMLRDRRGEVLFIDLRTWTGEREEKKYIVLSAEQIAVVKKIYTSWQDSDGGYKDVPELCRAVKTDEIKRNGYSLAPSKYIEFVEKRTGNSYRDELPVMKTNMELIIQDGRKVQETLLRAFELIEYGDNMEALLKNIPHKPICKYIQATDERNADGKFTLDNLRGISIMKKFIDTKADMEGVSLAPYKIVRPKEFAYVTVTSRNGDKISIAFNDSEDTFIVSSSYATFAVTDSKAILPEYLFMFLREESFDRYARFNSWGSARETLEFSDLGRYTIPVPPIEVQRAVVDIFTACEEHRRLAERVADVQRKICPVLIKGAVEEAEAN